MTNDPSGWALVAVEAGAYLVSGAALVFSWVNRRGEDHAKVISRIAALEQANQHALTSSDLHNMREQISELNRSISKLEGSLEVSTRTIERMNQFLMERGHG
jgi:hypothetical protein